VLSHRASFFGSVAAGTIQIALSAS
jgi:hypothetical protein